MNYIIFDLEFNQVFNFSKEHHHPPNPKCPFEIIDIGAVKLDEDLNEIETFDRLVKPEIYTRLHPFVKKMTGIKRRDLKAAQPFDEVYYELVDFLDDDDVLCVWGTADIKELLRNIEFYRLDTSAIPKLYIDVQHHANIKLNKPKGTSISLSGAAESLDIPVNLKLHNAFNDAFYTAEVFKKCMNNKIKPEIYEPRKERKKPRRRKKKATIS